MHRIPISASEAVSFRGRTGPPGAVDSGEANYASPIVRLAAWIVDGAILGFVLAPFAIVLPHSSAGAVVGLTWLVAGFAYYVIADGTRWQGTAGKVLLRIKVADSTGAPIGLRRALIRRLIFVVGGWTFFAGWWWMVIDRRRQGWHDKVARSFVLRR